MADENLSGHQFDLKPQILDYLSLTDGVRNFGDIKNLRYLNESAWNQISEVTPLDLDEGFNSTNNVQKVLSGKLDTMVEWLYKNPRELSNLLESNEPVFITFRGTIQTLMKMKNTHGTFKNHRMYGRFKKPRMYATKYKKLIFLCEDKRRNNFIDSRNEYRGRKAESLLLSDDPNRNSPSTSQPLDAQKEFCVIYQTRLNGNTLIYGGEVDGMKRKQIFEEGINKHEILKILNEDRHTEIIELKTTSVDYMKKPPPSRLLDWYVQCILSRVSNLYILGKPKNHNSGKVTKKRILKTDELSRKQSAPEFQRWNEEELVQYLNGQLTFLKELFEGEQDLAHVFKLSWNPGQVNPSHEPDDNYELLPEYFITFLKNFQTKDGNTQRVATSAPTQEPGSTTEIESFSASGNLPQHARSKKRMHAKEETYRSKNSKRSCN